jgi:hypothetical protein
MLKIDAETLSDVYKSSGSQGIPRAGCLKSLRTADQRPNGKKNTRKDAEDEERSVPPLG